jgi:ferritin
MLKERMEETLNEQINKEMFSVFFHITSRKGR